MPISRDEQSAAATHAIVGCAIDDLPSSGTASASSSARGWTSPRSGSRSWTCRERYTTASHDESDTGQQELYVALRGSGAVVAGDTRLPLDAEHLVRVDAGVDRVLDGGPGRPARAVRRRRARRGVHGPGVDRGRVTRRRSPRRLCVATAPRRPEQRPTALPSRPCRSTTTRHGRAGGSCATTTAR